MNGQIAKHVVIKAFVMNGVIKMGMTFNEHIGVIEDLECTMKALMPEPEKTEICTSLKVAIETMRKYQKIQEIVRWNNAPSPYYKPDGQLFRENCEVLEDGNGD